MSLEFWLETVIDPFSIPAIIFLILNTYPFYLKKYKMIKYTGFWKNIGETFGTWQRAAAVPSAMILTKIIINVFPLVIKTQSIVAILIMLMAFILFIYILFNLYKLKQNKRNLEEGLSFEKHSQPQPF